MKEALEATKRNDDEEEDDDEAEEQAPFWQVWGLLHCISADHTPELQVL
jgi:hypothetical protein